LLHRRLALLACVAACVTMGVTPVSADPTAPTHTITDELHGTWTDMPPAGTAPTPGVNYTTISVDYSDWWMNQPVHDRFEFSRYMANHIEARFATFDADGNAVSSSFIGGNDDLGFTVDLTMAPDFSWVRVSGQLHVLSWDETTGVTDYGAQPVDIVLTATSHQRTVTPTLSTSSADVDLGSGWATGSLTAHLGTLWSGSVPTARFDRTDHLVESTS